MARIKVLRMFQEKRNLILEWQRSVRAAAVVSILHKSAVNLQRHSKAFTRLLPIHSDWLLFFFCAFPFLSFIIFLRPLISYSCLFISVLPGSISSMASLWGFPDKTSQLYFSLSDISGGSISKVVLSAALFSLSSPGLTYSLSEWSGGAMEQNHSKQGSLMWPLWGSPAVGLVFNQAPGFNSQQACAPLTLTICAGCGGS